MKTPVLMFDFGNVIGFFDYMLVFERFGRRLGISGPEFQGLVESKGLTKKFKVFESGGTTPEEFSRIVQQLVGLDVPFEEFAADWQDIFRLNESLAAIIPGLKRQGYTLLLGSNTNAIHAAFYRRQFRETLDLFDHFVYSHEIRIMKPESGFFEACVRLVGAPASDCVFIDDVEENVQAARDAGLTGLVYRDTPGLVEELRTLGVHAVLGEGSNATAGSSESDLKNS